MKYLSLSIIFFSLIINAYAQSEADDLSGIRHYISAKVQPGTAQLEVRDSILLNDDTGDFTFDLNANLELVFVSKNIKLKELRANIKATDVGMDRDSDGAPVKRYAVHFKDKSHWFVLKYKGKINDDPQQKGAEYQRSFKETTGLIAAKGVYLAGSTYWIPTMEDALLTYDLQVELPKGWSSVSTGERLKMTDGDTHFDQWFCDRPQEEIYLIAAQFTQYEYSMSGGYKAMAFLRTPDEALANKYLEVTEQYMQMYEGLIGAYPYTKFALVENFWQTGYGMPSFTLLGDKIIRFPFILHSSYPHELLHNWWGNSVYVDFDKGNWCEGITAYEADHLIKEQRGQAWEYRRSVLQKFSNFVTPENDFPISKFINRYDGPSESIGYGKALMMWHMLRLKIGNDAFIKGWRLFYGQNKYKKASFDDIRKAMEEAGKANLQHFFNQWVQRTGAPELALANVRMDNIGTGYRLHFTLTQTQKDSVFTDLIVPLNIVTPKMIESHNVRMMRRVQDFTVDVHTGKPLKLLIDGQYDVFRKLDPREVPPAFSKALAGREHVIILPATASPEKAKLYRDFANAWVAARPSGNFSIRQDAVDQNLPDNATVWIIGFENSFADLMSEQLKQYNSFIRGDSVKLQNKTIATGEHGFMITTFAPGNVNRTMVFLVPGKEQAIEGLVRKLPHYGKYSYLAFEGDEPVNIAKGQWPVVNSPLMKVFDPAAVNASVRVEEHALAYLKPVFSQRRMMQTIRYLSSDELKGRGLGTAELDTAADYIAAKFKEYGLQPMDKDYFQKFSSKIPPNKGVINMKNVVAVIPGSNPELKQPVVVSAHYDHLGLGWPDVHQGDEGKIHHGADDNASGVAIMLELARSLAKSHPARSIIFLAATGEEAGLLGSRYFVHHIKEQYPEGVFADINLDTDGSLFDKKLLVLNANTAKEWKFIFMGTDYTTGIKTEVVARDLDASDQVAFIEQGVPAVQLFTGATENYHRPADTWEKIDSTGLVKVATVAKEVISYLAEREKPMPFTGTGTKGHSANASSGKQGRRVSTGSVPDFTYTGKGVRISSVIDDSPGAKAGLKAGDILMKLNGVDLTDLKVYTNELKKYKPGESVVFMILRDGKEKEVPVVLGAR